jgi:hypothetical protein
MSKALGERQKLILKRICELLPEGQMCEIRAVYTQLKVTLYSEHEYYRPSEWRGPTMPKRPDNYLEHIAELSRARVSISTSVKGLIKRGYLGKYKEFRRIRPVVGTDLQFRTTLHALGYSYEDVKQYLTYIYVTPTGRKVVIP